MGEDLDHEHGDHFLLGVDPEAGARGAAPTVVTGGTQCAVDSRVHVDPEGEAEPVARPQQPADAWHVADVVGRQELDGLRTQQLAAVVAAAVEQHLDHPVVVGGCRDEARAAVEDLRLLEIGVLRRRAGAHDGAVAGLAVGRVEHGQAVLGAGAHVERGVLHAKRREDLLLQEHVEGLARDHLDQAAQDVHAVAVAPHRARVVVERRLADLVGELLQGLVSAANAELAVVRVALGVARSAVADSGGVGQKILDRHVAVRRHQLQAWVSGPRIDTPNGDLLIAEGGDPAGRGCAEREAVLLVQDHHGDAGDRLAHRVDAEERVLGHRFLRLEVAVAVRVEVRDLAAAGDQARGAGDFARLDVAVHRSVDAGEALGRETDLLGLRDGLIRVGRREGGGGSQGQREQQGCGRAPG